MPYWEALRQGKLLYQRCVDCDEVVFHPRAICPYCLGDRLNWKTSAGKGKIYSFTVQHRAVSAAWKSRVPLALGIVELGEGFHMFTQFLTDNFDLLAIGRDVEVTFDKISEELVLPKFRLVGGGDGAAAGDGPNQGQPR